ncbi:MAG TPA: molybdopterin cofactor-binding domain-containing protein [Methylomirabilota bacterium]|jgi:carbon-monoxide dehydrogenase large subunit|nr:molybdopterin cofactor-binding domain-containing protein [Methylomirabilota bacterium]
MATATPRLMGAEVKRKEDPRLVTGTSAYVGDLSVPGMHYVAFVRSPHAHATVGAIDVSRASARPGVLRVVTGADIKAHCQPIPLGGPSAEGGGGAAAAGEGRKHYPLSIGTVRYVGEPVAAVIATSEAAAVDGAAEVAVDWRPLPAVGDQLSAMRDGAPQLHGDAARNVEHETNIKVGEPDAAFARANKVVKQRMVSQRLCGVPMEPRAALATPDPLLGGVTLWSTHQAPHNLRNDIATLLEVEQSQVRVIAPEVGGGFGVKFGIYPEDATLAVIARRYRVPVRWTETRIEHMTSTTHGRAQITDLEAAVDADGTITALRMHVIADIGAYPIFTFIPDLTLLMGVGVYKVTNVDLKSTCVFTNSTPVAAYRGAGRPEAAYYLERLVDVIAHELGKPPEEIRRRNFIPPSAFPYTTPTGQKYDSGEYNRALSKALDIAHYEKLRSEQKERLARNDRRLLGIGMAVYVEMCGFGPFESAVVRVEPGGGVTAFTGTSAHGQGHETTFAQIISDHLGVPFDKIAVRHGDTLNTPMGNGTGGSRSLAVGGSAILGATLKVQQKARRLAAHMLEAAPDDVVFEAGRYQVKGSPAKALTIAQIAPKAYGEGLPDGVESGLEATDFFRPPQLVYPFGAHVAVVEIDRDTGHTRVRDFVSVDDCGVRISPLLVAGQVHGGLAQGIAQALMEEVVYGPDGQLITGSLMDYAVPHAEDLPLFTTDQTVTPTPFNPMGAKGIGEAATIGSTPAVVNAVVDALKPFGVRHLDMPLKAERVWQALQQGKK